MLPEGGDQHGGYRGWTDIPQQSTACSRQLRLPGEFSGESHPIEPPSDEDAGEQRPDRQKYVAGDEIDHFDNVLP